MKFDMLNMKIKYAGNLYKLICYYSRTKITRYA